MNSAEGRQNTLEMIISTLRMKLPDLMGIYRFGSFGTEFENGQSDIDVAVLCQKKKDRVELWNLAQKIAHDVRRDVDLVDLRFASTVFQYQILTTGERIDTLDEKGCSDFEDLCYSMYLRLQEERLPILKDIEEGKRNYG